MPVRCYYSNYKAFSPATANQIAYFDRLCAESDKFECKLGFNRKLIRAKLLKDPDGRNQATLILDRLQSRSRNKWKS